MCWAGRGSMGKDGAGRSESEAGPLGGVLWDGVTPSGAQWACGWVGRSELHVRWCRTATEQDRLRVGSVSLPPRSTQIAGPKLEGGGMYRICLLPQK